MSEQPPEQRWTLERIHKEIYDARTKVFVVAKVLETGSISFEGYPEWAVVVKPLLKDLVQNVAQIEAFMKDEDVLKTDE
jgi:hypothetical protein